MFCPKYGTGSGSLVGKFGRGKMFFVGQKYSAYISSGGSKELKLKIRDSKYTDNSGEFDVDLVVIPHPLISHIRRYLLRSQFAQSRLGWYSTQAAEVTKSE